MKSLPAVAILVALATPSFAQTIPTKADQRRACASDAMRLCFAFIRDRSQMRGCMISHRDDLGPACQAVFNASLRAESAARAPMR